MDQVGTEEGGRATTGFSMVYVPAKNVPAAS